jgi:protease-4
MAISSDMLIERAKMKRQVSFWRLFAIGAVIFISVYLIQGGLNIGEPYVARVSFEDVITDDRKMSKLLDDLAENDQVKGIILHLNTPGGTAVGGERFYAQLKEISEEKPVVATMRSICTSAGYMIAIAANHVLAMEGTMTGSIGVIFQTAELTDLADSLGINPIIVKSGPLKGSPNPVEPFTEREQAVIQKVVDDFHITFITMVAEARDMPLEKVKELADGRIYSGTQAYDYGLVDDLGGEDKAIDWLVEKHDLDPDIKIRNAEPERKAPSLFDTIAEKSGVSLPQMDTLALDGLLLIWQPDLQ